MRLTLVILDRWIGAAAISKALKVNTCLTNLNLNGNDIKFGDSGAAAISEALKVNV